TTNRTHLTDYTCAVGPETGCLLKVHPSNFRVHGFTAEATLAELRTLADEHRLPLVADLGSGLLAPDPALPDEPDAASALAAGADLVVASGDKLLGGPQAGLLLGRAELIEQLARHPLARAVRADKLALAALEATLVAGRVPVVEFLRADPEVLRSRVERLAAAVDGGAQVAVVPHQGRGARGGGGRRRGGGGGGGGPGVPLPGWALRLPEGAARALRLGDPAVLARVHDGACLLDLRCVPETEDEQVAAAVRRALHPALSPLEHP